MTSGVFERITGLRVRSRARPTTRALHPMSLPVRPLEIAAFFLVVLSAFVPTSAAAQGDAPVVAEAPVVAPGPPIVPPTVVVATTEPAPEALPSSRPILVVVELSAPSAPVPAPEPVVEAPTSAPIDDEGLEDDLEGDEGAFEVGPVSLGLSGLVGTREGSDGSFAPTWTAGIDLGFRVGEVVSIGVRRLTIGATAQGPERWAFGASPYVELTGRVWERLEVYGQLGAALEGRTGLGSVIGIAPFAGGGVRFFPISIFSIALEGAAHVPVTDSFVLGHEIFPLGAVVLQGGLALAFHLG